ncbi:MAG: hypothetical protein KC731_22220 [Myxococcales bacterium]|nr:hypothetical protein [Myxococcales bacterium]
MVWLIMGTKEHFKRVPGGAQVVRHCDGCGERTTFYEKEKTTTLRLYFLDVFDYGKGQVMQCGACGACYATDEVGTSAREPRPDLSTRIESGLEQGGRAVSRAAATVGEKLRGLAADAVGRPRPPAARAPRPQDDVDLSDDDFAALDEMEIKFRALEEADRKKRS